MELERAVHLENAAGDAPEAERIYKRIVEGSNNTTRARAEATFRLADLYARQTKNAEAKTLILQFLRDFRDASDITPLAELELTKVTALLTRDQIEMNFGAMQHLGDLAMALWSALENKEKERASKLLQRLNAGLDGLGDGKDAPDVLKRLRTSALEISATFHAERGGGVVPALTQLTNSKDFEPFLKRGFPSDPHDVFAPAWRMKDRLSRALTINNQERVDEITVELERYLAPLVALPYGQPEGTLARITSRAGSDIRALAKEGKFAEARKRLDAFDLERYEQFKNFRLIATLLMRTPEQVVGAAWVVLFRAEQARQELNGRGYWNAEDHVSEALKVCRDVLPRVENTEVADLFKKQQAALQSALWEIKNDRWGQAQVALKLALGKAQ